MGTWFVYNPEPQARGNDAGESEASTSNGSLLRIPTTREDLVFSDKSIDLRSKRAVMRVLRFIMEYETQQDIWAPYKTRPFSDLLTEHFKLPLHLHGLFLALTLSLDPPQKTSTTFALPRIARHLRSTGRLGSGFNSVIPKWGGLAEIAQVACRAGAVGGGVYVLNKGIMEKACLATQEETGSEDARYVVKLADGERIKATWIAGAAEDLDSSHMPSTKAQDPICIPAVFRSISIIASPLTSLFPSLAEDSPAPAGAIVVFPSGSLSKGDGRDQQPVYLIIHSSDTGECPNGQSECSLPYST